jgi:PPOX class probable F420-dependent enzyme
MAQRLTLGRGGEEGSGVSVLIDEARAALTSGHLAHLVTLNPDGSPQVTIVWVGLEGDEIVSGHLGMRQKLANVRRDPRVVLSLVTGGRDPSGLDEYLVVHGTARITEGGAPELLQRLAAVYIGPGVKFPPMQDPPPGYVLRITPTRVGGVGPWARLPGS